MVLRSQHQTKLYTRALFPLELSLQLICDLIATMAKEQPASQQRASCVCDMQIVLLCLELVVGALLLVIGIVGLLGGGSFSGIVRSVYIT